LRADKIPSVFFMKNFLVVRKAGKVLGRRGILPAVHELNGLLFLLIGTPFRVNTGPGLKAAAGHLQLTETDSSHPG